MVTEGVYNMDGDSAPLWRKSSTLRGHHARLLVDDAHGIGVTGDEGGAPAGNGVKPEFAGGGDFR